MSYSQDNSGSTPVNFQPRKDQTYGSSNSDKTRPSGDPKTRRDFKKILPILALTLLKMPSQLSKKEKKIS